MADTALPDLTAGAACAAADLFYTTQSGNSRKVTGAQLQSLTGGHPGYIAGRWYATIQATVGTASPVPVLDLIKLYPFFLQQPATLSDLGARVVTGSAGENIQLAIYASVAATNLPTGNPVASTGNIDVTSTGVVSADITGSNVSLARGLYWGAINKSASTANLQAWNVQFPIFGVLAGSATLANISNGGTQTGAILTFAHAFGTWPDLTGQAFTETTAETCGVLYMKAA